MKPELADPPPLTLGIRALDPVRDAAAVRGLFERAADYVVLESGRPPNAATTAAFFFDRPPGADPRRAHKAGLFLADGQLAALADLCFGFPAPDDAYIGLLLIDPALRGQGLGPRFLAHLADLARGQGAPRLLLAVLEANPRARAFWERAGFRLAATATPSRIGDRIHVRHRMERRFEPADGGASREQPEAQGPTA